MPDWVVWAAVAVMLMDFGLWVWLVLRLVEQCGGAGSLVSGPAHPPWAEAFKASSTKWLTTKVSADLAQDIFREPERQARQAGMYDAADAMRQLADEHLGTFEMRPGVHRAPRRFEQKVRGWAPIIQCHGGYVTEGSESR